EAGSLRIISNDDAIQFSLDANNILRPPRRNESFPLTDGVLVNSGVRSNNLSILRNHRAGLSRLHSGILLDEVRIRTAFDEADLLGLGLFRNRQSRAPRNLADFPLGHFTEGEQGFRKLILSHSKQKIGLVLVSILATKQQPAAKCFV